MEDGHHQVLSIPAGGSELTLTFYQEDTVQVFSLKVSEDNGETMWYVGIGAASDMEEIDERVLEPLIIEGKYRDYWLPLRQAIVKYREEIPV